MEKESIYDNSIFLVFPTVFWSHNWERQHEFIYRFAEKTKAEFYIFPPLGYLNYNLVDAIKKNRERSKKKDLQKTKNPVLDNLHFLYGFKFIPIHNNNFIRRLNNFLVHCQIKKLLDKNNKKILWATYSTEIILDLYKNYSFDLCLVDLAQRRQADPKLPNYVKKMEKELVSKCDLCFADARATCKDYLEYKKVYYIHQGVSLSDFEKKVSTKPNLADIQNIPRPIVGYIGALHRFINYDLLFKCLDRYKQYSFVFIGSVVDEKSKGLLKYKNVYFLGSKPKKYLTYYLDYFDVGLVPYKVNDFTNGIFPTKLFEYGIKQVPTVTTNLQTIREYKRVFLVAKTEAEFIANIDRALKINNSFRRQLYKVSYDNRWEKKFDEFYHKIKKKYLLMTNSSI